MSEKSILNQIKEAKSWLDAMDLAFNKDSALSESLKEINKLNDCIGLQKVQLERLRVENEKLRSDLENWNILKEKSDTVQQLRLENKKLRDCIEKCLCWTSMRDPQVNTHRQACDQVEKITWEYLSVKKSEK